MPARELVVGHMDLHTAALLMVRCCTVDMVMVAVLMVRCCTVDRVTVALLMVRRCLVDTATLQMVQRCTIDMSAAECSDIAAAVDMDRTVVVVVGSCRILPQVVAEDSNTAVDICRCFW